MPLFISRKAKTQSATTFLTAPLRLCGKYFFKLQLLLNLKRIVLITR
jgi:hypothetical protein